MIKTTNRFKYFTHPEPNKPDATEKNIEAYLRTETKKRGGWAMKNDAQTRAGVPDRLVLMRSGLYIFVEVKRYGKKPTDRQRRRFTELLDLGCNVCWLDCKEGVDAMFKHHGKRGGKDVNQE